MPDTVPEGLNAQQMATIDAIVGAFECGRPFHYGQVAASIKDKGGFSYGKHQVSHTSGGLHALISEYCKEPAADIDNVKQLKTYLPDLKVAPEPGRKEANYEEKYKKWRESIEPVRVKLIEDTALKNVVGLCAADPAMRRVQDAYFHQKYMLKAIEHWTDAGFKTALGLAIIYDTCIHSGPGFWTDVKGDVEKVVGAPPSAANEPQWLEAYCQWRRDWMLRKAAANPKDFGILEKTVYRPDTFLALIKAGNWSLSLPVFAHACELTPWDDFPGEVVTDPFNRGAATDFGEIGQSATFSGKALFVQRCLVSLKLLNGTPDGKFGSGTKAAVIAFQDRVNLPKTGRVDAATYEKLCVEAGLAEAERQGRARTTDGLAAGGDVEKKSSSGVGLGAATAVTAGGAVVASMGANQQSTDDAESLVVPGGATSSTVSVPATVSPPVAPAGPLDTVFNNTTLTLAACGLFVAAVVLFALWRRRASMS